MNDHSQPPRTHERPQPGAPETPVDAGSQALSEALRSSFAIVKFVMVALVVVFIGSGFFKVGPGERAVILRFGKPVGEGEKVLLTEGLHWSLPYPIEEYQKISITGVQQTQSTIGWYAITPEQEVAGAEPPVTDSLNPAVDGYLFTADGNIVHARATLVYRIEDPIRFIFEFTNAPVIVQNALNNALVYAAAHFNVDDILTRNVAAFRDAVRQRTTELLEAQNVGVVIQNCEVPLRIPPRKLKAQFDNVLQAEVTRSRVLNEARSYENQVLSKAGADATSIIDLAEYSRVSLVKDTASEAQRFADLLPQYNANPALFVQYALTEKLGRVLTNVQEKIYLPQRADGKTRELRLLLNRELPKRKPAMPNPPNP